MRIFACTILENDVSLIGMRHGFHKTGACHRAGTLCHSERAGIAAGLPAAVGTGRNQENLKLRPTRAGNEGGGLTVSNAVERYVTVSNA